MRIPRATLNSFVGHMEESKHIDRFSFQKDSREHLVLTIQSKHGFGPRDAESIRGKLASTLGALTQISVRVLAHTCETDQTRDQSNQ